MVTVTERARQELRKVLEANIDEPDVCLRLVADADAPGQFSLVADREREDDQVIEHAGDKVLLVGSELGDALEGATIDHGESAEGLRLVISRK